MVGHRMMAFFYALQLVGNILCCTFLITLKNAQHSTILHKIIHVLIYNLVGDLYIYSFASLF
ncbi:hypothetical protein VK87_0211530 [Escherichia fergusonii]|nr:hypothetical protein VK87_0211530 [Escherichia fergusonii]